MSLKISQMQRQGIGTDLWFEISKLAIINCEFIE